MKAIHTTILLLGCAWPASAQDPKQETHKDKQEKQASKIELKDPHVLHRAKEVIGADLRTPDNEEAGEVKEVLIDSRTGAVKYVIVDPKGSLERDDQLLAMPAQVLQVAHDRDDPDDCFFLVEIDKERLRTAPAFDNDEWPDLKSTAWAKPIDEFYARDMRFRDEVRPEPASTGGAQSYCVKGSKVRGLNLKTMGGEGAGEIEEVVFDPALARVAYIVLSTGGFLGLGEKHFALPWQALVFTPEGEDIQCRLAIPESKLEKAPEFKNDDWKRMSDRTWLKEVYTYYGYPIYWTDESPRGG